MSLDFFSANFEALRRKDPELAERLETVQPEGEVVPARSGMPSLVCNGVRLHSVYDPVKEAERLLGENKKIETADLVFCLGLGQGYLPEQALKRMKPGAVLIVVENRLGLLRRAMESRYLLELFCDERLRILSGVDRSLFFSALADRFPMESCGSAAVLLSPFTLELDAEDYKAALQDFSRVQRLHLQTVKTMDGFAEEWTLNTLKNLPQIMKSGGVADLIRILKKEKRPAVVIGAGPSLQKKIPELKKHSDRALLLAVDTAAPVLAAGGITPHLVFSFDSQKETLRHFEKIRAEELSVVFSVFSPPELVARPWKRVFFSLPEDAVGEWIQSAVGFKGSLRQGGSVSSVAFDFARQANCDPIIFLGQDLSFKERTHAGGSAYEDKSLLGVGRFQSMEGVLREKHRGAVAVTDIRGERVLSWPNMLRYAEWFSEECKATFARCINATGEGILKEGVEVRELSEALKDASPISLPADLFLQRTSGKTNTFFLEDLLKACRHFSEFSGTERDAVEAMRGYPVFSYLAKSLPILYRGVWEGTADENLQSAFSEAVKRRLEFIKTLCPWVETVCECAR